MTEDKLLPISAKDTSMISFEGNIIMRNSLVFILVRALVPLNKNDGAKGKQ